MYEVTCITPQGGMYATRPTTLKAALAVWAEFRGMGWPVRFWAAGRLVK